MQNTDTEIYMSAAKFTIIDGSEYRGKGLLIYFCVDEQVIVEYCVDHEKLPSENCLVEIMEGEPKTL